MCQLKRQNLTLECLYRIFDAIVVCKLIVLCRSGLDRYTNAEQFNVVRKLFAKVYNLDGSDYKNLYNADELFEMRDQRLFKSMSRPNHCLHPLSPESKMCYNLRDRGHTRQLLVH